MPDQFSIEGFLTGSRRYGLPTTDSDTDVVLLVRNPVAVEVLMNASDANPTSPADDKGYASLRFGKVNAIVCQNESEYLLLERAMKACCDAVAASGHGITRDIAVEIHKKIFNEE